MTEYYIYKTETAERWDTIAYKFYGNCYLYTKLISANPHVAINDKIPANTMMKIPKLETTKNTTTDLPIWKQN